MFMSRFSISILFLTILSACSEPVREEIISRFDSGEKRVVAVYRGDGSNEQLIERQTYIRDGTLVLLEDLTSGLTKSFLELNPEVSTAVGLADFLSGVWYEHKHANVGEALERIESMAITFADTSMSIEFTGAYVDSGRQTSGEQQVSVTYHDEFKLTIDSREADDVSEGSAEIERNPVPVDSYATIKVIEPEIILIREFQVFDGGIELPSTSVNRLMRSQQNSESERLAWGEESDRLEDALRRERKKMIERHFPGWAARRIADSDRSIADILDGREYRRERAEELQAFLERTEMSISEYQENVAMSEDEFARIYLFNDDGTIPPVF